MMTKVPGFCVSAVSPITRKSVSTRLGQGQRGKTWKLTSSPLPVLLEGKVVTLHISLSVKALKGEKEPSVKLYGIAQELTLYLQQQYPLLWRKER